MWVKLTTKISRKSLNLRNLELTPKGGIPLKKKESTVDYFIKIDQPIVENEKNLNKQRIVNFLICDDQPYIVQATYTLIKRTCSLNNIDACITKCSNGIEALYKIYSDYNNGKKYEFLITDENMPFIKGSLLTSIIKTMNEEKQIKEIYSYIVSGYDEKTFGEGSNYIEKPIRQETIVKILKEHNYIE